MIKYFSLFSGIGGLEKGLEKAGHECVGTSEIKKSSSVIYAKHYPKVHNYGDITMIKPEMMPDFDMLIGGFPCQSFSLAGLRNGLNDGKGIMIFYIRNFLVAKKPRYFVLENVKGLLSHDDGRTYVKICKLLQTAGYQFRVILLNSAVYGSAQARERIFFLGCQDDFPLVKPRVVDMSKKFKDVFDELGTYKEINKTPRNEIKMEQKHVRNFEVIGMHDRVGTLTTQYGCGEKAVPEADWFRYLTVLECERLQGFPEGWTEGIGTNDRYFALGNAVNCYVSEYLFTEYLPEVWGI